MSLFVLVVALGATTTDEDLRPGAPERLLPHPDHVEEENDPRPDAPERLLPHPEHVAEDEPRPAAPERLLPDPEHAEGERPAAPERCRRGGIRPGLPRLRSVQIPEVEGATRIAQHVP